MHVRRPRRIRRTIISAATGTTLAVGSLFLTASPAAAATTATFLPSAGVLSVFGDVQDNAVSISRTAAGTILVNGGAIPVSGGTPTVANTQRIQIFGLNGNDTLFLLEANGALPAAFLFGGTGNDTLIGGSGADQLFGQGGNDVLNGGGGFDVHFGGTENDAITGGRGDDQAFGEAGNDRMIWNNGDGTDLNEGGAGTDQVEVNGGDSAENFRATANGTRVRFDRLTPAPFSVDIGTSERLQLDALGGADQFDTSGSLAPLISVVVEGGTGNDVLRGSDGNDVFVGEDGNDFVDGENGDDVAFLGAGDDTFQWDPGDDNDIIEGQGDVDTMLFNGSNAGEQIEVLALGGRAQFTRDIANVRMDFNDLERVAFNAFGGADRVRVRDLSGTDVTDVITDLAVAGAPDASSDTVTVDGTNGDDVVEVTGSSASQLVTGLSARVTVLRSDPAPIDRITIAGNNGTDVIIASSLAAPAALSADGGDGDDVLLGGNGDDLLSGGNGDDVLLGGPGTDTLNGGPGDDVLLEGEIVTDGLIATKAWLATHTRPTRGGVVLEHGGKQVKLPGVSAAQLRR